MKVHDRGFDYAHEQEEETRENMVLLMICMAPIFLYGIAFIGITVGFSAHSAALIAVSAAWIISVALMCVSMAISCFIKRSKAVGDEDDVRDGIALGRNIRITVLAIAAAIIIGY